MLFAWVLFVAQSLTLIANVLDDLLSRADMLLCDKEDRPMLWQKIQLKNCLVGSKYERVEVKRLSFRL